MSVQTTYFAVDRVVPSESLRQHFDAARPFPHLVLDDCLDLDPGAVEEFPDPGWEHWTGLGDAYQKQKFSCNDIEASRPIPSARSWWSCASRASSVFSSRSRASRSSSPTPTSRGVGSISAVPAACSRCTPTSTILTTRPVPPHQRAVYLNPDWSDTDGGDLRLGDGSDQVSVTPGGSAGS